MRSFKVAGKKNSEGEKKAFPLKGIFLELFIQKSIPQKALSYRRFS
jgi:hypothetical protein